MQFLFQFLVFQGNLDASHYNLDPLLTQNVPLCEIYFELPQRLLGVSRGVTHTRRLCVLKFSSLLFLQPLRFALSIDRLLS